MKLITSAICQLLIVGSAHAFEAWGPLSDPNIMNPAFERHFDLLPMSGRASNPNKFWSGDYWPLNKGNINYRWNADDRKGFGLYSPSKAEVMNMSQDELAALAPTEKYDIFVGRYDYPLKAEVAKIADRKAKDWEGICHGWAPATTNHEEPTPKTMTNPDGVRVPFGSADIKALISYYYSHGFQVANTHQMGRRCDEGKPWFFSPSNKDCKNDLNPGAFHIVITNKLGIEGEGFVADLDRYKEVWNHPIMRYETRVTKTKKPESHSAPGTARVVKVKTKIWYVDETRSFWEPVLGTNLQEVEDKEYEYDLDIDYSGNIIGGKWDGGRPDFLWIKAKPSKYEGNLSQLGSLLND